MRSITLNLRAGKTACRSCHGLDGFLCRVFGESTDSDDTGRTLRHNRCLRADSDLLVCEGCDKAVTHDAKASKKWILTEDDGWLCPSCAKDVDDSTDVFQEDEQ